MNIVFVGLSGVPFQKRAIDIRLLSFADLFAHLNHNVFIINRYKCLDIKSDLDISDSIQITHIIDKVPKGKIQTIFYILYSLVIEPIKLIKLNRSNRISIIHIASGHFVDIFIYWLIAKTIKAKVVYHYCEYRSAFKTKSPYHIINGWLVNKVSPLIWDGAICISNFLVNKAKEVNSEVRIIKVPPICDFDYFQKIESHKSKIPYLLFCGSVNFKDTIDLIIKSFYASKICQSATLKLILNGDQSLIDEIQIQYPEIEVYQNLEYSTLISFYKGAIALLIPLRNTIQDTARFPNKICEYLASEGNIMTTNYGEIKYYFQDSENALIADFFEVNSYSQKMNWLCDNIDKVENISKNAYKTGRKYFHTYSYTNEMEIFLSMLVK